MRKYFLRLCSMVLTLVMLCNMLPPQAVRAVSGGETQETTQETSPVTILGENTALRTQTQKHFLLSDGTSLAVSYGVSVHYQDDDGAWQEIDNTLALSEDGASYLNENGQTATTYAAILSAGQLFTTSSGSATVSTQVLDTTEALTMITGQGITPPTVDANLTYNRTASASLVGGEVSEISAFALADSEQTRGWTAEDLIPAGLSASVLYEDVYPGVDLKYTAYSTDIKEQIIVKQAQSAYRYDFFLALTGVSHTLNSDGSITLADSAGNTVYTIPAPYMEDSAGEFSTDVAYTVASVTGGIVLTVEADADWINTEGRSFPVTIDPTLKLAAGRGGSDIYAAFTMEANTTQTTLGWKELCVGNMLHANGSYGRYRLFLHFNNLPELPAGSVITDAALEMYCFRLSGNKKLTELPLAAYDVTTELSSTGYKSYFNWFNGFRWGETEPDWDASNVLDYAICTSTVGYRSWNLTDSAKKWYSGSDDATIAIVVEDESVLSREQHSTAEFYKNGDYPIILTVTYRSITGLESYYSYTTQSAGRAGTGYVNNYSGGLTWVRNDIGFGGNRMPVSISHIYNTSDAASNLFGMGYGWRTNFNQRVYQWDADSSYYVWEDADGTAHYFKHSSANTYQDEDGLSLTLTVINSDEGKYRISDKYNNCSYFDSSGRLISQVNNQREPSRITVSYDKGLINGITDGAGRVYTFSYNDGGLLTGISYEGSGRTVLSTVTFDHNTSGQLTSITDRDGKRSTYTYNSSNLLTSVTDVDGYKLTYKYQAAATGSNSQVISVEESDGNATGGTLSIAYAHNQTTLTDVSGNVQIIQFNNWGNAVSVQDGEGRGQFARYARDLGESGKGNQLRLSSKLQNTVGNRLDDSSFERSTAWSVTGSAVTSAIASGTAYHGSKALKLTRSTAGGAAGVKSASFTVAAGETYTFSAYVKTGSGMTAYLALNDGSTTVTGETLAANSGWTRLEVSYTNSGAAARNVTARLLTTTAGTAYMDCVQVEKAPTASRYNLVENGDFRYTTAWSASSGRTTLTAAAPELSTNVYKMTGNPTSTNRLSQTVQVSGNMNDTFVLAGWALGNAVPFTGEGREFAIIATFLDSGGNAVGESVTARFNPDSTHWQYAAAPMVAAGAYSSIKLELAYDYNANTVCFDGIQLYKEEFGSSYTYDGNGNVTAVKDTQGGTTTYTYDKTSQNLMSVELPDNSVTKYTYYENTHNVKTATTAAGVVYTFEYDKYGNNTSVSIGNGITARAEYSGDGNRLIKTTDAAGNVTTYNYNAQTNVLEWVKYPKDTDATKTSYTYDTMYRLASAAASTGSQTLSASYTYTDDLLTGITTASTTYSFGYGNFGLRSNVKIGSRTLASYTYTDDGNNYLKKLAYGNGDSVQYEYDNQGRVTKQTYEDGDTVTYKYDNSGALATVTDSATGRTTTYYYDFTDRLMKYVEKGSGYSHSVGYEYDNINNLTALVETINGVKRTTSYVYDDDNRVASVTTDGVTESYTYDSYGRVEKKETAYGGTTVLTDTLNYHEPTNTTTSGQVAELITDALGYDVTYTYTYDDNGNILSVSTGANNTTSYVYDSANQLVRENNQAAGKTWVWTYDNAGNILSRKEYAYTTGTLGAVLDTVNYAYSDSAWGDLLTAYEGEAISYDGIGNPLSDGVWTYTWEHGRQLASMYGENIGGENDVTVTYTYDSNGMRTGKTVTTNIYHTHSYTSVVTAPTCTTGGYTTHTCACGDSYVDALTDATGHTYTAAVTAPTCTAGGYTTYTCTCGDSYTGAETAALGHDLVETEVPPTETEQGYTLHACTRCDYSYTTIHTHSYTTAVTAPTCTADGYTTYTCTCGDSYQGNVVAATGHDGSLLAAEAATCTEAGYEDYYCSTCGEVYTVVLPATGHTLTDGGLIPWCTVCNYNRPGDPNFWSLRSGAILEKTIVTTYSYVYNGGSLSQMTVVTETTTDGETTTTTDTLYFAYDAAGTPQTVTYNGTNYYYATNIQGDVTAILNTSGTAVVQYTYDAWGNILSVDGSLKDTLGFYNPLRYRGYVYDHETGLYYLQSRYYNPAMGRFINADNYPSTGQGLLGNNMFAYCNNNPVVLADPYGEFGWFIIANAVIGAVVGAATQIVTNAITKQENIFAGVAGAAVGGAVYNVVALTTGSLVAASAAGSAAEALTNEAGSYLTGQKKLTADNLLNSAANVVCKTAENTITAAVTGKIASGIVKTNRGWFQPKMFISSFAGKYAQKIWGQTATQGALTATYNTIKSGLSLLDMK